ncbi:MAG: protein involved in polysaccharide export with SLBB domain [Psychromonas sp.]|jgi:protein involved in polysaccharide export with SLBB domain
MIKLINVLILFCVSLNLQAAQEAAQEAAQTAQAAQAVEAIHYTLDAGDKIRILVYDEPDLTVELVISDDGSINYPFVGRVSVTGKTTAQVQKLLHDGLNGDYLKNPSVQVDIISYRPFYIHGEVNKPGAYPYQPGLTIDQAVALAGGYTERASRSSIYLKSENINKEIGKGENVGVAYSIHPGDTITIEQSFF